MTKLLLSGLIFVAMAAPALALECPVASEIDDAATAALVQQYLPADIDLDAPDAPNSAIFELTQAGVAPDLILDNLIATYCASVAANTALSEAEKTQRVDDFSKSATDLVYPGNTD